MSKQYTRSTIDWSNPPKPGTYSAVTLEKLPPGPAMLTPHTFAIFSGPRTKKGAGIWTPALIYYVREACIRWPAFREELLDMITKLPTSHTDLPAVNAQTTLDPSQ